MTLLGLLIIAWALTPPERPYSNHISYYDEEPWPMTSAEEREFWLASARPKESWMGRLIKKMRDR